MSGSYLSRVLTLRKSYCHVSRPHHHGHSARHYFARKSPLTNQSTLHAKVTFGDSEGRSDTLAGSLAAGWSVTLPADIRAGGGSRSGGDAITKALTGTNAIVCAAGGGPLPSKAAMAIESARQNGVSLNPAESLTAEGRDDVRSKGFDGQVRRAVVGLRLRPFVARALPQHAFPRLMYRPVGERRERCDGKASSRALVTSCTWYRNAIHQR